MAPRAKQLLVAYPVKEESVDVLPNVPKLLTPCLQESRLHQAGIQILAFPRAGLDFCWAVPDQGLLTHSQDNFSIFPFQGRMPVY